MTIKPTDVAVAVSCILTAAEGEPSYKDLPLEGKLIVLKSAAGMLEHMIGAKAAMEAIQKSLDNLDK